MIWSRIRYKILYRWKGGTHAWRASGAAVGENCRILSMITTSEPWLVTVADRVTISTNVTLLTHDGSAWLHRDDRGRRYRYAPIRIGSDVFVGSGAIIMPGVRVGDRCVIGAGSVVTKSVPTGSVVAGNPARYVTSFDEFDARLAELPTERDLFGETFRERVDSIAETNYRPEMTPERPISGGPGGPLVRVPL